MVHWRIYDLATPRYGVKVTDARVPATQRSNLLAARSSHTELPSKASCGLWCRIRFHTSCVPAAYPGFQRLNHWRNPAPSSGTDRNWGSACARKRFGNRAVRDLSRAKLIQEVEVAWSDTSDDDDDDRGSRSHSRSQSRGRDSSDSEPSPRKSRYACVPEPEDAGLTASSLLVRRKGSDEKEPKR